MWQSDNTVMFGFEFDKKKWRVVLRMQSDLPHALIEIFQRSGQIYVPVKHWNISRWGCANKFDWLKEQLKGKDFI